MSSLFPDVPRPLCRSGELRQIERRAFGAGHRDLMERAGLAAAEIAREMLADTSKVLVLAGPGNNGGDALVAARHLRAWWYDVTVVFAGDPARLSPEAAAALAAWHGQGGEVLSGLPSHAAWGLVVDGLFGIGLERDLAEPYRSLVERVNSLGAPVLSLDVPSGLDSDTGKVRGMAIRANRTVTFIALKPGLLTLDGPDHCGEILLRNLGLEEFLDTPFPGCLLDAGSVRRLLPQRPRNSHKGSYGSVAVVGGADSMVGAALLAGRAALRSGAGRVYVGLLGEAPPAVDFVQPELMLRRPEALTELDNLSCAVIGPGLGQTKQALQWLEYWLAKPLPLVLDADALNLVASHPALMAMLKQREGGCLLTPHPAEAARLGHASAADIQEDRIQAALDLAGRFHAVAVLKGNGTVVALPDGQWFVNASGNPGLASAGTGDVLSGMAGAFIAQGLNVHQAARLAVHLHGAAADRLVRLGIGPIGMTAMEVADAARLLLNEWLAEAPPR